MKIKSLLKRPAAVFVVGVAAAALSLGFSGSASAQNVCSGPLGPAPCEVVADFMARQGLQFVATNVLPRDGQIVMQMAQACRGEPRCMAIAWTKEEVSRCRGGWGVPGGCFGPNGEIMRAVNTFLPENFHPNVIIHNVQNDLTNGPGDTNDITGRKGWLRGRLGL